MHVIINLNLNVDSGGGSESSERNGIPSNYSAFSWMVLNANGDAINYAEEEYINKYLMSYKWCKSFGDSGH